MKKYRFGLALTLTAVLVAFSAVTFAEQPTVIRLSTHNLCPYGCYTEDGRFDGYAIRVIRYALEKMDVRLELVVVPWERAQYLARIGDVDGFFAASQNADRDSRGTMSAIIAEQKWNWYLLKSNPLDPTDPEFKRKARVSSFIGANMLKWLQKNDYTVSSPPRTTDDLLSMLLFKRFDAALANNLVMDNLLEKRNLAYLLKVYTLKNKPLGVYFSNDFLDEYPEFLDEFNERVKEYKRSQP